MFTGLIEQVGTVVSPAPRLRVACRFDDVKEGDSISVSGCCLTALDITSEGFSADLAPETVKRTKLGDLTAGAFVNLERCLRASDRLGGHIVQGHVDGTGTILAFDELGGGNWWLKIQLPEGLERYVVAKGSIAIDGISLTVAALSGSVVEITIIPHTIANTALRGAKRGDRVNIEVDVLAKYLEKLTHGYSR